MIIKDSKLKELQNSNIKFEEEGHLYERDGVKLPSVTTILKEAGLGSDYSFVDEEVLEKARLRGEAIHCQVEYVIKNNDYFEVGDEAEQIVNYLKEDFYDGKNDCFKNLVSEGIIQSNNPIKPYAGRFDLLGKNKAGKYVLFDIKTMKSWNGQIENYTRWQLSLYARALGEMGIEIDSLIVLKFETIKSYDMSKYRLRVLPLQKISDDKIERLLRLGVIDKEIITISKNELDLFKALKQKEEELKAIDEQVKEVKRAIYEYMKTNDILKATSEDGKVSITRTKDSSVVSVDRKRLEVEMPEIFAKYKTESKREGSVRITIKD